MRIGNSENRYGAVAITLHWLMALLIIVQLSVGLYMVQLLDNAWKLKVYGWHKENGALILILVAIRLLWRLGNVVPRLWLPRWEKLIAQAAYWALYGFMFAMPLSGWLLTSAAGRPFSFFGLFIMSSLIAPNPGLVELFAETHKWLGYGLIAVIVLHVCGALKHHFYNKDTILRRILPW